jgi:hypothetical protein
VALGYPDCKSVLDGMRCVLLSRLSTKEVVTDISGRGVGLDAVKDMVLDFYGKIDIKLLEADLKEADPLSVAKREFLAFEFVIMLPREMFL